LHGLGGAGKTQLSVEFCRSHHAQFTAVFWLFAEDEQTVKEGIRQLVDRMFRGGMSQLSNESISDGNEMRSLESDVQHFLEWLSQPHNNGWLLIFDNVDGADPETNAQKDAFWLKRYLPAADHGSVLITSRIAKLGQLGEPLKIRGVGDTEARSILKSRLGEEVDGKGYAAMRSTPHSNTLT
jgi:hypothetical protein